MSTRTIIEINHDYLASIYTSPENWKRFLTALASGEYTRPCDEPERLRGIRILGQRHHSETLTLEVE